MSRRRIFEDDEVTLSHHNKRLCPGLTSYDRYTVAWMCALHIEMAAARAMLDEEHDSPPKTDSNSYVLGTIQKQHVVIACLPASAYGTNNAAIVLSDLKRTFPNIDVCLMVGIGGGVPTNKADIRLGDVVVGTRVMQYDLGKTINGELQRTGVYKHPGFSVLTVVSNLRSRHELEGSRLPAILKSKMEDHAAYGLPTEPDRLFKSTYNHPCPDFSCDECDQDRLEVRKTRLSSDPVIYYGAIASSNQVMKDATCRDKIAGELDILCFEMEAAGLMDIESCLPIRGICDYSDSHKAKGWQRYAAATAASYAYELLQVRGQDSWEVEVEPPTDDEEDEEAQRRKKRKREQRRKKILESLDFEAIDTRKTTIKFADRKTCQWFLKNKEYLVWKDPAKVSDHHGFLWIRGKPGAGKSTIMKFIYLATRKKDKKNEILTASFFFNARGETLEKTISGMYRSLLLQLLIGFPDLQNVLDDSDLLPQHQTTCPSLNCLKTIFQSAVLKLGRRTFTCFIDALDECDEQQVMDLVRYFEDIAEVCTENRVCLRICFSSRHYPYIDINRGMRLTLENQEGHADDLGSYIKSNLRIKDKDLVTELEDKMLAKASGVFLWVVLVVDVLNDENRRGRLNLRNRLEQIPNGLSELFQDILRRDASNAEELQLCLLWILFSKRPLRPDEYYHALWSGLYLEGLADSEMPRVDGTDAGDCFNKSVISSSKGLAEITKAKIPTVQFIHESVRDFLIKDRGLAEIWPGFQADWESFGHDKLKRCCHLYLQLCYTMETDIPKAEHLLMANRPLILYERNIKKRYPFVEYASQHVLDHADSASNTYCQVGFMRAFPTYDWISIVNEYEMDEARRYTLEADILYILADRGCSSLIRTTLKADPAINVDILGSKERYGHPLTAAMANGDKESVVALLKLASPVHEGVDLTVGMTPRIDSIVEHPTPLSWACENGHLGIAKLLVQRGMSKDVDGNWTLFTLALENGNIETVKWLMGIEDDIRKLVVPDTAIFLAVKNGCADIVELLLNRGIKPDSVISSTPILCLALAQGHDAIVRLILEKGGDVAVETKFNKRPIHLAKSKASMKALIEHGADINARDSSGRTALWDLIRDSRLGELDFLCQNGADVNAQDNEGNTCLHVACLDRIDDLIFPILLKYGGDINARNNDGNTPLLLAASRWGHENFKLDAWVTHGADINAQNNRGQTLLDFAVDGGDTEAVAFLAQRGAARGIRVPGLRNEGYNIIGTLNKN